MFDLQAAGIEFFRIRALHRLTQIGLAKKAREVLGGSIYDTTLSKFEIGQKMPAAHVLFACCVAMEGDNWAKPFLRVMKAGLHYLNPQDVAALKELEARKAAAITSVNNESPVRKLRLKRGMTQKQLGAMVGYSDAKIGRIERGECDFGDGVYMAVAEALGYEGDMIEFVEENRCYRNIVRR